MTPVEIEKEVQYLTRIIQTVAALEQQKEKNLGKYYDNIIITSLKLSEVIIASEGLKDQDKKIFLDLFQNYFETATDKKVKEYGTN